MFGVEPGDLLAEACSYFVVSSFALGSIFDLADFTKFGSVGGVGFHSSLEISFPIYVFFAFASFFTGSFTGFFTGFFAVFFVF